MSLTPRSNRRFLLALVVLLTVPLTFLLLRVCGGFVRDVIAVPVLYLVWIGRLYLRAIPPVLFWGAFLLFAVALAVTSLLAPLARPGERQTKPLRGADPERVHAGQVKRLASQIRFATRSTYFRRRLAQRLGELMVESLEVRGQPGSLQIERGLDLLDAPPEIRAFLREGQDLMLPSRPAGLISRLRRRLRGLGGTRGASSALGERRKPPS